MRDNNPFGSRTVIGKAMLLAVIPAMVAIALAASNRFVDDVTKMLYSGAGALLFGGLLGGTVKLLLDDVAVKRSKRAEAAAFVSHVLQDLKSVHDRVARARILITAHQSAKTYGDEMRDLIDAQVQLRNVNRALERSADGVRAGTADMVNSSAKQMRDYLRALTLEFEVEYKPIADLQRLHEKRVSLSVEESARAGGHGPVIGPVNEPWEALLKLDRLREFLKPSHGFDAYETNFGQPLDDASAVLRRELAWIYGSKRDSEPIASDEHRNLAGHAASAVVAGQGAPSVREETVDAKGLPGRGTSVHRGRGA